MKRSNSSTSVLLAGLALATLLAVAACGVESPQNPSQTSAAAVASPSPTVSNWPPLPSDFRGDFTMDMPTMKKLAGDSLALPIAGQFKSLSITAVDDDGTVKIKALTLDATLDNQPFKVTINAFHSHVMTEAKGTYAMAGEGSQAPQVAFVWHDFNIKLPEGGSVLHLLGVFQDGKLLGYSYNPTELANLKAGAGIPVLGATGWRVMKVMGPPTREAIQLAGGGRLRLLQAPGARVGLVP